jgi:hypothetical protein
MTLEADDIATECRGQEAFRIGRLTCKRVPGERSRDDLTPFTR